MMNKRERERERGNKLIFFSLLSSLLFCNYGFAQGITKTPVNFPTGMAGNSNIIDSDGNNLGNLSSLISTANNAIPKSQIGVANGVAPLDSNSMMSAPVSGDTSVSTSIAHGSTISNKMQETAALISNLKSFTYGDGSSADALLLDSYVSANCGQMVNVPDGYILPTNSGGGAHFPDTSTCTQHYTWVYNTHLHTTGGTETDFRTPDDLHINYQNGMMSLSKTKLNTATADPQMLYLQFINRNQTVGPVSSNDTTRQSLKAVELNMQAAAGSTGSLNGFQCDMTDRSTTGDNANVCAPSNVFKYSSVGKDWAISLAGYDYSATQPTNTISYTGIENDLQVSGQDMGASLWDTTQGGRHLMWLGANTVQYPAWQASHEYSVGDKIVDANKSWVWIVTAAGTSSTGSDPTGSWQPATGSYTDGTVTFKAQIDYHGVVSKAIYVINDHVDDDYSYYDDVLAVNANVRDASINLTKEILTNTGGASIRLASDHPIDFSGDGTAAGKNLHTLSYSSTDKALEYDVGNSKVFVFRDSGVNDFNSGTMRIGYTYNGAVGMSVGSSTTSGPSFIDFLSSGTSSATVRLIANANGLDVKNKDLSVDNSVHVGSTLYLGKMTKSLILSLSNPVEGQKVFDTDDHEEVTYRCTTATTCGWAPVQYGPFISN